METQQGLKKSRNALAAPKSNAALFFQSRMTSSTLSGTPQRMSQRIGRAMQQENLALPMFVNDPPDNDVGAALGTTLKRRSLHPGLMWHNALAPMVPICVPRFCPNPQPRRECKITSAWRRQKWCSQKRCARCRIGLFVPETRPLYGWFFGVQNEASKSNPAKSCNMQTTMSLTHIRLACLTSSHARTQETAVRASRDKIHTQHYNGSF
jgi:hypothetical protein